MMLVLTRKLGERIVIAENIEITVVKIRGNRVRLGLTMPRHISVQRLEVQNRIGPVDRGVPAVLEAVNEREAASPQAAPG